MKLLTWLAVLMATVTALVACRPTYYDDGGGYYDHYHHYHHVVVHHVYHHYGYRH